MPTSYTSLVLNSKRYSESELAEFCLLELASNPLQTWKYNLYNFILQWISHDETISVKSSGSTGKPKTIRVSKKSMVGSAKLTGEFLQLKKENKSLLCIPVDFIAGKMMVVRAFVLGLDLIPVEPSGNPLKDKAMDFDFSAMTPMQVYNILIEKSGIDKLNNIKHLLIGGGDIDPVLRHKIQSLTNNSFHTYGMTETITHIALKKISGKNIDTHFKALKNVWFDKDARDCLVVNASHISPKSIVTNDIVLLKSKTTFDFIGRYDNIINSGGIKIIPERIEHKLEKHISQRFFMFGKPDEKLGEKVVLIIEGVPTDNIKQVLEKISFSKYEKPKEILFINQFVETENGKINRKKTFFKISNKQNNYS